MVRVRSETKKRFGHPFIHFVAKSDLDHRGMRGVA